MIKFLDFEISEGVSWSSIGLPLQIAFIIVGSLLIVATIVSIVISIWLWSKYVKFNRKQNSLNMNGKDIARKILDDNELTNIKVKCSGSMLFGNSYSHYFKKVRLRRLTWKKKSVTALAMASQKSSLAILDKEGDPDMIHRIKITPFIYFGPLACIPLILVGVVLDVFLFGATGVCSIIGMVLGFGFYALSFIFALKILKTEVKAQNKALQICKDNNYATDEELEDMKSLFKLYNIEYVNDMIIALLELIWRILQILAQVKGGSSSSSSNN